MKPTTGVLLILLGAKSLLQKIENAFQNGANVLL